MFLLLMVYKIPQFCSLFALIFRPCRALKEGRDWPVYLTNSLSQIWRRMPPEIESLLWAMLWAIAPTLLCYIHSVSPHKRKLFVLLPDGWKSGQAERRKPARLVLFYVRWWLTSPQLFTVQFCVRLLSPQRITYKWAETVLLTDNKGHGIFFS